ncbi:probable rhamnogalacturonate lyase B isoform X1 [Ricinus communis]|uniref:probable rhamnogalacturonate lyase B isoform X1 n=2 Tax=Ricinus communis TaxID=3988 RepID=UPI00201A5CDE|nr:probable rhamnogalacturonate lyase B isoform X1 [Ricinus communis]XP_048232264.1 probable rhamnogalacturonate lyase B isoform X1 [Ricinus communis]
MGFLGGWRFAVYFLLFAIASSVKTPVRKINPGRTKNSSDVGFHVQLQEIKHERVVIDNGIIEVTLSSPDGNVIGIKYRGIDNVLESLNEDDNRGYWDVVWNKPDESDIFDKIQATDFSIIMADEDQVEVSFSKKWDSSRDKSMVPLNIDKRYIVRRGCSGLYVYAILERLEGWPDVDMDQIRVVFKLRQEKFHFMAVSDDRQRIMPMPEDRATGQPLAYPEAVLLTRPTNPELRGEVDDKYQYSCEDEDNKVHGWTSDDPPVGFWMITPSNEFRVGGPMKQDLTSHVGPTVLNMFSSNHYAGKDLNTEYRNGEPWKKVLGPVFVYLNSMSPTDHNSSALWEDAKAQMSVEVGSWPYDFVQSEEFPSSDQRGTVSGQLLVRDRYINERLLYARSAYVGLAPPGYAGSWQRDSKGYQFWTRASRKGIFSIKNVRPGNYSLYAWVPGVIGDYKYNVDITILPGSKIQLRVLIYDPPRNGPTLWEIGIPDRSASEFYVPDTYPTLMNKLYTDHPTEKFRQYGLWARYADLYPNNDLVYTVGVSNYVQDWFFAHVNREIGNKTYDATTWQIIFQLDSVKQGGNYTLQLALASATVSEILVRFNDPSSNRPLFTTGLIGTDNAIARHGIHGLYWLFTINVPSDQLRDGKNIIYLTQARNDGPFRGVMYDYIRLEGPAET